MGDDDVTVMGPVRATWASIGPAADDAGDLARFALAHSLRDVFLVVPWYGSEASRASALLRGEGLAVAAVGADPRWATDPRPLMQWIRRVRLLGGGGGGNAQGTFSGVHLDVEPWRLPLWDRDRLRATRGLVILVRHARELVPDLPLSADLPHWLAGEPYWPPLEADGQEAPTRTSRGRGGTVTVGHAAEVGEPSSAPAAAAPSSERRRGGRRGSNTPRPRIREVGAGGAVLPGADTPGDVPLSVASVEGAAAGGAAAGGAAATMSAGPLVGTGAGTGACGDVRSARSVPDVGTSWSALVDEPGLPAIRPRGPSGVAAPRRSRTSVFEAMLDDLDSVTILVPRTRAHGQGGILDVSAKARSACMQRGVSYMIGLETRPTSDPRRPRASFHDAGALAL
ncbi:MAG: hypothetical protein ACTJGR_07330, partial [Pauljensenia sp.]